MDVKYDILFIGDVDYDTDTLEATLKSKLSGGNTLGSYVLDANSIDVYGTPYLTVINESSQLLYFTCQISFDTPQVSFLIKFSFEFQIGNGLGT